MKRNIRSARDVMKVARAMLITGNRRAHHLHEETDRRSELMRLAGMHVLGDYDGAGWRCHLLELGIFGEAPDLGEALEELFGEVREHCARVLGEEKALLSGPLLQQREFLERVGPRRWLREFGRDVREWKKFFA